MSNIPSFSVKAPVWNLISKGGLSSSSGGGGGGVVDGIVYNYEIVTESQSGITVDPPLTYLDVSSSHTFSLANGTEGGLQKVIENSSASSVTTTVSGTFFSNNSFKSSIDMSITGSSVTLLWNPERSAWVPQFISDATLS
jgi:hypothetical protein